MSENNNNKNKDDLFTIYHWNCFAVLNKIESINMFLNEFKPDILSLNEIKLNDQEANYYLRFKGYSTYFNCRKKGAGGVALLVRNETDHHKINEFDYLNLEIETVSVRIGSSNVLIASYYNPPDKILQELLFLELEKKHKNYIICGDLNAKSELINCRSHNSNGNILVQILSNSNAILLNSNDEPTYFSYSGSNCELLDRFVGSSSLANLVTNYEVVTNSPLLSDHLPIKISINAGNKNKNDPGPAPATSKSVFNYGLANWGLFSNELKKVTLSGAQMSDIDAFSETLTEYIHMAARKSIPIVKRSNRKTLPNYIVDLIKTRRKLNYKVHRLRRKNDTRNTADLKNKINMLTKIINHETKEHNHNTWTRFLDKVKNKPVSSKAFWAKINKMRSKPNANVIPTLIMDGKEFQTDLEKSELFGARLANTFSESSDNNFDSLFKSKIDKYIAENYSSYDSRGITQFTLKELEKAIKSLKNKSSSDQFGISNALIKHLPLETKRVVLSLFNKILATGSIPKTWKEAEITMIPKKGDSWDPKNYRPISITACLSKLFEKLVAKRINQFLKKNNIIVDFQSGFRKHRQTKDNIFFMTQKVAESFARKKKVCGIFFDISSAFDKIWHNGLIYKLDQLKFPHYLTSWIKNFIENRNFKVRVGAEFSKTHPIKTGVPQGAVLSPLLFSIFINDIPANIKKNNRYSLLFADDLCYLDIFNKVNIPAIQTRLNKHIRNVELWLKKWRLTMAAHKCNYMIFCNSPCRIDLNLNLFGQKIPACDNVTFLGMRFDKYLCFKNQVDYLEKTCFDRLNIIKILSHKSWKLNSRTLIQIYNTLVRSIIEYSAIISPRLSNTNMIKLQVLQNNAVRAIYNYPKDPISKRPINLEYLHSIDNLDMLVDRLDGLAERYLVKALENKNPLITESFKDYLNFCGGRGNHLNTLFCPFKDNLRLFEISNQVILDDTNF